MKIAIIHWVAKALGVLVNIEGLPYGSARNLPKCDCHQEASRCRKSVGWQSSPV
jgi:hypothetical protein